MDQLICPACNEPAVFTVTEGWPPIIYTVSADREVVEENSKAQRDFEIACEACGAEPDEELWDEIYQLSQGKTSLPYDPFAWFEVIRIMHRTEGVTLLSDPLSGPRSEGAA
jgi:hypothetical protein